MGNRVRAIAAKEIRESLWKIWLGLGLLIVIGGSLGPMYGLLGALIPQGVLESLPGWIKDPMMQQLYNYRFYLWGNWYGKNLYQMVTLLAVVFGAGLVASETSRGTAGFLFSKPVRRTSVLRVKYFVALGVLWLSAVAGTVATVVGSSFADRPVDIVWFAGGLPAAMAGGALILALTLLSSVVSRDTVKAAALAIVVLIAVSAAGFFRQTRWASVFVHMTATTTLVTGAVQWAAIGGMLLASALIVLGAERILVRKDI